MGTHVRKMRKAVYEQTPKYNPADTFKDAGREEKPGGKELPTRAGEDCDIIHYLHYGKVPKGLH